MAEDQLRNAGMQRAGAHDQVATIPLADETVTITKRQVERERIAVHVRVTERNEVVAEQLLRDNVEVERVPRNTPLTELPTVRLEGTTTIIPVVEEVLVVEKRLMLVEEIHIHRRSGTEERQIPVVLRREEAQIDRTAGMPLASETRPGESRR